MSGIINSAGAKSGVIGTTEIDYEEGTFTPIYVSTGATFASYSENVGWYTRVGRVVHINGRIRNSALSGTTSNACTVQGLPFTSQNVAGSETALATGLCNFYIVVNGMINYNTKTIVMYLAGSTGQATAANANTNFYVFSGSYII